MVVVLSTELTEELDREGLAREFGPGVQETPQGYGLSSLPTASSVGLVTASDRVASGHRAVSPTISERNALRRSSFETPSAPGVEPIEVKLALGTSSASR